MISLIEVKTIAKIRETLPHQIGKIFGDSPKSLCYIAIYDQNIGLEYNNKIIWEITPLPPLENLWKFIKIGAVKRPLVSDISDISSFLAI